MKNIFFESATIKLQSESKSELKRLARFLRRFEKLKFEIAGYTDNVGSEKTNLHLSEQRAKTIYDYLIKAGISSGRLKYKGYGSKSPVADNNTEEGRQQNRRTEFRIIEQ